MGHVYRGTIEDGVRVLTRDGRVERAPPTDGFAWGAGDYRDRLNTAIRILTREGVPAAAVLPLAVRLEEEVIGRWPADKGWTMTSDEIVQWMAGPGGPNHADHRD